MTFKCKFRGTLKKTSIISYPQKRAFLPLQHVDECAKIDTGTTSNPSYALNRDKLLCIFVFHLQTSLHTCIHHLFPRQQLMVIIEYKHIYYMTGQKVLTIPLHSRSLSQLSLYQYSLLDCLFYPTSQPQSNFLLFPFVCNTQTFYHKACVFCALHPWVVPFRHVPCIVYYDRLWKRVHINMCSCCVFCETTVAEYLCTTKLYPVNPLTW